MVGIIELKWIHSHHLVAKSLLDQGFNILSLPNQCLCMGNAIIWLNIVCIGSKPHSFLVSIGENCISYEFVTPKFPSGILENGLILTRNLLQGIHFFILIDCIHF